MGGAREQIVGLLLGCRNRIIFRNKVNEKAIPLLQGVSLWIGGIGDCIYAEEHGNT